MKPIVSIPGFKPLMIKSLAVGVALVPSTIESLDLDTSSLFQDDVNKSHIITAMNNDYKNYLMKSSFYEHLGKWKNKMKFVSSLDAIIDDEDFKEITKYGVYATPLILEEIQKEPSYLVWALNIIYNRKLSADPNMTIPEACKLWCKHLAS